MKEKSIPLFSLKLADEKSENVLIGKDKIEIAKNELTYFRSNSKKVGILKENLQALLEKLEAMNRQ